VQQNFAESAGVATPAESPGIVNGDGSDGVGRSGAARQGMIYLTGTRQRLATSARRTRRS
jgi:hypothetical protein